MKKWGPVCMCVLLLLALLAAQADAQKKVEELKKQARIYGKVAVILKSGEVRPIAKGRFLVLPFSLWEFSLKALKENPERNKFDQLSKELDKPISIEAKKEILQKMQETIPKAQVIFESAVETEIQKYLKSGKGFEFKTEFDGAYEINVPAGKWYICSSYQEGAALIQIGPSKIAWSLPVTVQSGQQLKLDLSNENAVAIY